MLCAGTHLEFILPGERDAGVAKLIRIPDAGGCQVPLGVEVFQDGRNGLPPAEVARRVADATRAVIAEARG